MNKAAESTARIQRSQTTGSVELKIQYGKARQGNDNELAAKKFRLYKIGQKALSFLSNNISIWNSDNGSSVFTCIRLCGSSFPCSRPHYVAEEAINKNQKGKEYQSRPC